MVFELHLWLFSVSLRVGDDFCLPGFQVCFWKHGLFVGQSLFLRSRLMSLQMSNTRGSRCDARCLLSTLRLGLEFVWSLMCDTCVTFVEV